MRILDGISADPIQLHTVPLAESDFDLQLTIRFYPTIESWYLDLSWNGKQVQGVKLSLGVLHVFSENLPFDFFIADTSENGIDPFKLDDFESGRIQLGMLSAEDMIKVRGVEVATE